MGDGKGSRRSKDDRRRHRDEAEQGRSGGGNKLTEEEQRLYDKARAYVEQEEKTSSSRSHRRDKHHSKSRHRKERKKKDKSRDKKYHPSDEDDSDVSSRRERDRKKQHKRSSRDGDDDRYEKSRSKKKSKHRHHHDDDYKDKKKHSKHSSRKSREKTKDKYHDNSFRQKATKLMNKNLISLGEITMQPPQELLHTDTNYFSHNSHLRLYLYRHYGIYFEDLTSNESHDAFQEFVSKYNNGELETAYYDPKGKLPQEALDQCSRTQHKWNFSTNRVEEQALKMVRDGVKKQTEYDAENNISTDNKGVGSMVQQTTVGPMQPVSAAATKKGDEEHNHKLSAGERRLSDKRHRERIKVGNEEMYGVGKADRGSWERKIEKRREQSNRQHGAARDRESEAGAVELDDNAIYGGGGGGGGAGDISYEAALAREKKYREKRDAAKNERTTELLKKEEDKQKKMLEMLGIAGLKPGEKIKIQPRQP